MARPLLRPSPFSEIYEGEVAGFLVTIDGILYFLLSHLDAP